MAEPRLAAASVRLRGKPGRPRTRPERSPAPVVQVGGVAPVPPRLLDVEGTAAYLAVSSDAVREMDERGQLRRVRLPGAGGKDLKRVLYDRQDLDEFIERHKESGA